MLEDVIISRVRVKILTILLGNPNQIIHVRELVRQTKEEINAVRRELLHMENCGMVVKEQRANRLYYSFRKEYPLYSELSFLIAKTNGLGGNIIKNKNKLGKIKFVMFSGKFVRRIANEKNSVEVIVIGNIVLPELSQLIKEEEAKRGVEINYTVMTEDEFSFRKSRKDPFIMDIISGSRLIIIGDEEELLKRN